MIADLFRTEFQTDIAISNSGGIRANTVINEGQIKLKLLNQIFPFKEKIMKTSMKGSTIIEALENGVG